VLGGGLVATGLLLSPTAALFLSAFVVPIERVGRFTDDSSMYAISLMRLVGVVALASLLLHLALKRKRVVIPGSLLAYGAYTVVAALSITWSTDPVASVRTVGAMLGNVLFFFVVVNALRERWHARVALALWLVCTVAVGAYTIYQWHNPNAVIVDSRWNATGQRLASDRFSTVLTDFSEYEQMRAVPRAIGTTSAAAVYGINLILALPFLAYFARTGGPAWRLATLVAAVVVGYNVLLTNTRAALITLVVTAGFLVATRLLRITATTLALVALLSVPLLAAAPAALYTRIFTAENYTLGRSDSLRVRLSYWKEALGVFADHWLVGVGVGNQAELPKRLSPSMYVPPNTTAHNEYLQSLMETGLSGFPLLVLFGVLLYGRLRAAARSAAAIGDADAWWLIAATRVSCWTILFYAVQVDVLHFPLKAWWLAVSVGVAVSYHLQTPRPAVESA
jgi:O-antigen ligase